MRCPKLKKSNSSMLVLFDESISSVSTSQNHHPLCQSILDPWMTPRCGFCPKNIRSFFPSWRQHYSDHLGICIVSKKYKHWLNNELNNHVSHVITTFLQVFLTHVGSLRTLRISSLNHCRAPFPWYPIPFSIFQHLFQPKKKLLSNPHAEKWKKAPCPDLNIYGP